MPGEGAIRLTIREPSGGERELQLDADVIRLGRARDCDVPLESGYISRYHARLERSGRAWQLIDEGSKNGVILNGRRVSRNHALFPGDSIRLGDVTLTFQLAEAQDSDRTIIYPFASARAEADAETTADSEPLPAAPSTIETPPPPQPSDSGAGPTVSAPQAAPPAAPPQPANLDRREAAVFTALASSAPASAAAQRLGDAAWAAGAWDNAMLERLLARLDQKLRDQAWQGVSADDAGGYQLIGTASAG